MRPPASSASHSDSFGVAAPRPVPTEMKPAERRKHLIDTKVDTLLRGLTAKLDKHANYSSPGKVQVKAGKTLISIRLASRPTSADLAKLKELGFEQLATSKSVAMLIGRISVTNIESLAQLACVARIAPVA